MTTPEPSTLCSECGDEAWSYAERFGVCISCQLEAIAERDRDDQEPRDGK